MGEKREGTLPILPDRSGSIKQVFETPHYRVVVVKLSAGPADAPEELRIRYVILSKEDPVVAAHSGLKGEAIALALTAEDSLQRAVVLAAEHQARNYKPQADAGSGRASSPFGGFPGGGAPNLS